jgi:hypothetical protein
MCDVNTSLPIARNEFCPLCHASLLAGHERNVVDSLRGDNLLIEAFFETAATRGAHVVLVLEIAMGTGLLLGARLARKEALSATRLVPIRHHSSEPSCSCSDDDSFLPRSCASQGSGQAGQDVLRISDDARCAWNCNGIRGTVHPAVRRHKRLTRQNCESPNTIWMRSVLMLWWVVLILGMATYTGWYVPHLFRK